MKPEILVFDVNETLLDLRALAPHFVHHFGTAFVMKEWFSQVLQTALSLTITGKYTDFGTVGRSALAMTAARHNVQLSDDEISTIVGGMLNLPPHSDVIPALTQLKEAGFRLAALTNSAQNAANTQLTNAGLAPYFERILSVEMVQQFKPAEAVYTSAARELGVRPSQMMMVAAHDWDVEGAMSAGCMGVLVTRPGVTHNPLYHTPTHTITTLTNLLTLLT